MAHIKKRDERTDAAAGSVKKKYSKFICLVS